MRYVSASPLYEEATLLNTMTMNIYKTGLGLALGILAVTGTPLSAHAFDLRTDTSLHIQENGLVKVLGAKVTSISGNVINTVVSFGDKAFQWAINVNGDTKITANNTNEATVANIRVNDILRVSGTLSSISPLGLTATHIIDTSTMTRNVTVSGTIKSLGTGNTSLVLTHKDGKTITVTTTNTTTVDARNTEGAETLNSLKVGDRVVIKGTLTGDAQTFTASSILINTGLSKGNDNDTDDKDERKEHKKEKRGFGAWFSNKFELR